MPLKSSEIKHLESEIKSTLSNISQQSFQYFMQLEHEGHFEEEYSGWTTDWMSRPVSRCILFNLGLLGG